MPRPSEPSADDLEDYHRPHKLRKAQVTCSIDPAVKETVDLFCKENGLERSAVLEACLKTYFQSLGVGLVNRRLQLRAQYLKITQEIKEMRKLCGPHYDVIKAAYKEAGGKDTGDNCEQIFPLLYNHLSSKSDKEDNPVAYIPFFEQCVTMIVEQRKVLELLTKIGKEKKVEEKEEVEGEVEGIESTNEQ